MNIPDLLKDSMNRHLNDEVKFSIINENRETDSSFKVPDKLMSVYKEYFCLIREIMRDVISGGMFESAMKIEELFKIIILDLSLTLDSSISDCNLAFKRGEVFAVKNMKYQLIKERDLMLENISSKIIDNLRT
jgi:hypothetical protein